MGSKNTDNDRKAGQRQQRQAGPSADIFGSTIVPSRKLKQCINRSDAHDLFTCFSLHVE